jgi:hypothetical protein
MNEIIQRGQFLLNPVPVIGAAPDEVDLRFNEINVAFLEGSDIELGFPVPSSSINNADTESRTDFGVNQYDTYK